MRFSLIVITHHFQISKRIFRKYSPAHAAHAATQQCCCSVSALCLYLSFSFSVSLSVSLAPLHYCLIAISAKQASSQNDYYELAGVSSLCIMQSPCHAWQQRLAHTHTHTCTLWGRDRHALARHLDTHVAIKLQMPSAHCPCCCFVAAVEERVENISLKCVPPLECSSPIPLPPLLLNLCPTCFSLYL